MTVICMRVSFDDEELGLLQQTMPWTFLLGFFFLLFIRIVVKQNIKKSGSFFWFKIRLWI